MADLTYRPGPEQKGVRVGISDIGHLRRRSDLGERVSNLVKQELRAAGFACEAASQILSAPFLDRFVSAQRCSSV
jgi:hypothetical protein